MAQVTTYNFTIDDTSPQLLYSPATSPSSTPDLLGSWNQYFNGSGLNAFPGQVGRNASLHITGRDGASFSVAFTGTGINLYGLAVQSSFSLVLDDKNASSSFAVARLPDVSLDSDTDLLASISGLTQKDHVLAFIAHTSNTINGTNSVGFVIFDRAVITVSTGLTDASVATNMISDTEMHFTGSWTFMNDSALISEDAHCCHVTQTSGDQASYSFRGSSVQLAGLTNATSGNFNVTLSSEFDPSVIIQQQISGSSAFTTYTTLFYASGLDSDAAHMLTITNLENKTLAIDAMNVTVVSGGQSVSSSSSQNTSASLSRGGVAGIAVACTLALLLILGIIALLLRCRWRRRNRHQTNDKDLIPGKSARPDAQRRPKEGKNNSYVDPGQGLSSPRNFLVGYDPSSDTRGVLGIRHLDEEDGYTDSGHGHGQNKRGSIISMPSFDNIPREPESPTRHTTSPRSFTLSRWSGWFTSSTGPSSASSRHHAGAANAVSIVSPRPIRIHPPVSVLARADSQNRRSSSFARADAFLDIPRASPFQVDFEKQGQMRSGAPLDSPQTSNTSSLGAHAREMLVSFLDFASSGTASLLDSSRPRSRSQRLSGSNKSYKSTSRSGNDDKLTSRPAADSSEQSQTTSTGLWTVSLSVEPPQRVEREVQQAAAAIAVDTAVSGRHPFSMVSADLQIASQESPTDSLPMSVSDINFRTEEEEEDVIAERNARFHLPRHPPLPSTPHSYSSVPNAQQPDSYRLRASHMRQMSAPSLGADQRRPYVAQTSIGRRLELARAHALESQASLGGGSQPAGQPGTPDIPEQPITRPSSSRTRILPLSFIHFGRSGSGSG